MKKVLSTKVLTPGQSNLLIQAGLILRQYNAIETEPIHFNMPKDVEKAVFTSQNAVESVLKYYPKAEFTECFCVGTRTAEKLTKNGYKLVKIAKNGEVLGVFITKGYKNARFFYFCGNIRRDNLPNLIKSSENELIEVKTYKTELNSIKIDGFFDGIMFFSPSGVKSFSKENEIGDATAFCIGETTAASARQITRRVVVANSQSVESVIAKMVKTLQNDKK